MNAFGNLLSGLTPATTAPFPDGNGLLVQTLDGQHLGVNSDGQLTYSHDTGDDQRWQQGDKCLWSVNRWQGVTQYFFLEWF